MNSEWATTRLGDWAPLWYGKGLPNKDRRPGPVPVYSSAGLTGFHDQAAVQGPAVVIGRKGTVGAVYRVAVPFWPIDTTFYIPDSAERDLDFTFYALKALEPVLASSNADSAVPGLNREWAHSLAIRVPDLLEQRRIAGVLRALDDKMEHDRNVVDSATQIVELIFVHRCTALVEGQPVALTTIADFVNGGAFTKHANGLGRPIVRIKELNDGVGRSTLRTNHKVRDENIARHHDLLFSWSGSLDVYRWAGPESIINQHIFKVIPRDGYPRWFVEGWLRHHLSEFQAIAHEKATTMGHIKRHHLDDALVNLPDTRLLAELDATLGPLDELQGTLRLEMRRLSAIRDALLPKLISGQIRVPDSYDPDDVLGTVVEQAATS